MPLRTTVGQLMVNAALPADMVDYTRVMDKKGISDVLRELSSKHPDKYREVAKRLSDVGRDVAYTTGGSSFGLRHLRPTPSVHFSRQRLNKKIDQILSNERLDDDAKEAQIIAATSVEHERLQKEILEESKQSGNPLADQVISGSRGNPAGLKRLIGGRVLLRSPLALECILCLRVAALRLGSLVAFLGRSEPLSRRTYPVLD